MKSRRWTRDGLAAVTGISQGVLTQYRAGREITVGDAIPIAQVMGITLAELLSVVYGYECDEHTAVTGALARLPEALRGHFFALVMGCVREG